MKFSNPNKIIIDKYLPHNFLAEKMILSCLLVNSEAIEITLKSISIDMFYFKNHQKLYKIITYMHQKNIPIDILTLMTFLQDNGLVGQIGGVKVIMELLNQMPNLVYLEKYLQLLKEKYIRRSFIKLGYELVNSSYVTNISLDDLIMKLEKEILNLTAELQVKKLSTSLELITKIFFELKTKSLNPKLPGLLSGFNNLDNFIHGFQKSDLIIIAGRPSMGKTALSLSIATNIIKTSKTPILFFSLEMSQEQIMYRLLSMETNITQMKLKSGQLSKNDWIKLNKMIQIFSKFPFFIDDRVNLTIQDIKNQIRTILFEQNELGLVIIDYIQLMQNSDLKNENRVQELSKITRALKTIAREFNVPIIGLSQLSRNVENRADKKPILSDLRESGSIEQDADIVLMLSPTNFDASKKLSVPIRKFEFIDLIVAKHRNGPTGIAHIKFDKQTTKFFNLHQMERNLS
jgi:replicative DNA helicase